MSLNGGLSVCMGMSMCECVYVGGVCECMARCLCVCLSVSVWTYLCVCVTVSMWGVSVSIVGV